MANVMVKKLEDLIEEAGNCKTTEHRISWRDRAKAFLQNVCGKRVQKEFDALRGASLSAQIGYLQGLSAKVELGLGPSDELGAAMQPLVRLVSKETARSKPEQRVFIVHGHDNEAKEAVARFVQRIGLTPVILHEQANRGRAIIEKLEAYSEVAFAVILLTPDDIASPVQNARKRRKRARQNVIFELGYFLAKLGREKVCALYVSGVEIPSDYQGVLYIKLDSEGAWKTKLAQEIVQTGMSIKLDGLL
jgi:predicted nucleotide-binding protein